MLAYLVRDTQMKKARTQRARARWTAFPSVHVLPELLVKEVREYQEHEKHEHHDVAGLLALQLIRLRHPGHEIHQVAHQDVVIALRQRSGNVGLDRLEDEARAVLARLLGRE